ncbi:MAG: DUF5689 domain-containing protein, partial [Bacteroidota bacterium]
MPTIKQLLYILLISLHFSCQKKYDIPPLKSLESASKINIVQVKSKFNNGSYRFKGDSNLYCVVIADEISGNLYKEIYVQDITGGIHIKLNNSGGLFIGDSLRINLQNCILNANNNLIQLDSVDTEKNIVKLASGLLPKAKSIGLKQIFANSALQSCLVQLQQVEFVASDKNMPYADATGKISGNRTILSCEGQTLTVRTSGYANFASQVCPIGNGTITGVLSQYGSNVQLLLRQQSDVQLSGPLCGSVGSGGYVYHNKDFNDNIISSGGWTVYTVNNPSVKWSCSTFSGTPTYGYFAKISGYVNGANNSAECWLISPSINLSTANDVVLNFETAAGKFAGAPLEIYISQDYLGGAPSTGKWSNLSPLCVLSPTT